MATEDISSMNIYQRLAKIRSVSDVAQKSMKGYNYRYTDINDILAKVTAGMKKYRVSLIPTITPGTAQITQNILSNTKFDKTGKSYINTTTEMLFTADMMYRWVNDDNPEEYISVPWFVTGSMSDPAQAVGSGLTYTQRQFLQAYFQIAQTQDTDVDAYRSKQREAEVSEDRDIASKIIAEFDKILKIFLSDNPDKKEEVIQFVSRYAKKADYNKIKEPALASKLLDDFVKTFGIEEVDE
jgi:hypothetical protein